MAHLNHGPQVAQPPGRRKTGGSHHATAAPRHPPDPWTSTQPLRQGTARPPTTHAQSGRRSRRGEDAHRGRRPGIPNSGREHASTGHLLHLHPTRAAPPPVRARQGPKRPARANTSAPPSAVARSITPAAARSEHARRRAIVAARSSPQRPPSSRGLQQRPARRREHAARARMRRRTAFPGRRPASAPDPAAPTPASPSSSRRRGPRGAAAAPSAHPRAATRDEVPAAAHSRASIKNKGVN
nr:uncharacterized protein LOC127336322 [Lolium perenne]